MKISRFIMSLIVFALPMFVVVSANANPVELVSPLLAPVVNQADTVSLFGIEIGGTFARIVVALFTLIGLASALVKALTPLVEMTETKKDDAVIGFCNKWLKRINGFLDKYLALNPSKSKARNG